MSAQMGGPAGLAAIAFLAAGVGPEADRAGLLRAAINDGLTAIN